jgi:hypothetical protein
MSYYDRGVILRVQVSRDGDEWTYASGELHSVEGAVSFAKRHATGLWRVRDAGGNVHESGDEAIHERANERRRLLEEAVFDGRLPDTVTYDLGDPGDEDGATEARSRDEDREYEDDDRDNPMHRNVFGQTAIDEDFERSGW